MRRMRIIAQATGIELDVADARTALENLRDRIESLYNYKLSYSGPPGTDPYDELIKGINQLERQLDQFEWTYG